MNFTYPVYLASQDIEPDEEFEHRLWIARGQGEERPTEDLIIERRHKRQAALYELEKLDECELIWGLDEHWAKNDFPPHCRPKRGFYIP